MWDVVGRGSAGLGGAVRGAWARWRGWGRRERWMNRGKGCGRGDVGAGVAVRRTARGCGLVHRVGRTRTRAVDGLGRWAGGRARCRARGRALGFAHPGDGHAWDGCMCEQAVQVAGRLRRTCVDTPTLAQPLFSLGQLATNFWVTWGNLFKDFQGSCTCDAFCA